MPTDFAATREVLHLIGTHVLARRRYDVTGRFGLRASVGGFAAPAFGPEPEVLRVSGIRLVRDVGSSTNTVEISGATLKELATFAGADLDAPFDAGKDMPDPGDPDAPLNLDPAHAATIADWYATGWQVLDDVIAQLAPGPEPPATIQLWPEHFDAATVVTLPNGERVNLGFSPGDSYREEPYLYVGPWGPGRPGPEDYWNAPFGAVATPATTDDYRAFLRLGLTYLQS